MFWFDPSEEQLTDPVEFVAHGSGMNQVRASVMELIDVALVRTTAMGIFPGVKAEVLEAGEQLLAGSR
jgi:hypothetical protein